MLAAKEEMLISWNPLLSENSRPGYRTFSRPLYWRRRFGKSRKALGKSRFLRQNRVGCYERARYYSPKLQRFISEDPIRFYGGDWNFYAYVGNNPLRYRDPLGLLVTCIYVITVGACVPTDNNNYNITGPPTYIGGEIYNLPQCGKVLCVFSDYEFCRLTNTCPPIPPPVPPLPPPPPSPPLPPGLPPGPPPCGRKC